MGKYLKRVITAQHTALLQELESAKLLQERANDEDFMITVHFEQKQGDDTWLSYIPRCYIQQAAALLIANLEEKLEEHQQLIDGL